MENLHRSSPPLENEAEVFNCRRRGVNVQAPRALESEAQTRGHAAKPTLPTGTEEEDLEIRCWRWEEKEEEEGRDIWVRITWNHCR